MRLPDPHNTIYSKAVQTVGDAFLDWSWRLLAVAYARALVVLEIDYFYI